MWFLGGMTESVNDKRSQLLLKQAYSPQPHSAALRCRNFSHHCTQRNNQYCNAAQSPGNNVKGDCLPPTKLLFKYWASYSAAQTTSNLSAVCECDILQRKAMWMLLMPNWEHSAVPLHCLCGSCYLVYWKDIQALSHVALVSYVPFHHLSLSQDLSE